jgi:hypothetical protein
MKKVGLLGLGNKSESTLRLMKKSKLFDITGVYDQNISRVSKIADHLKLNFTSNPFGLIMQSDLLIIPKVDEKSYNLIVESILNSKHVVIENPLALTLKELEDLLKLSSEASVSIVPLLPFRFNNCLMNTKPYIFNPSYIHITYCCAPKANLSIFEKSEELINVIDIIINLVKANVKQVQANSIKVVGNTSQLIACRFEFDNGCTANLTMDFISNKDELLVTVYQNEQIVTLDLVKNYSLVKTFNKDNILKYDVTKPVSSELENIYEGIIVYLNTFETYQTPVSLMESFKNSLTTLKKVEDKIAQLL